MVGSRGRRKCPKPVNSELKAPEEVGAQPVGDLGVTESALCLHADKSVTYRRMLCVLPLLVNSSLCLAGATKQFPRGFRRGKRNGSSLSRKGRFECPVFSIQGGDILRMIPILWTF